MFLLFVVLWNSEKLSPLVNMSWKPNDHCHIASVVFFTLMGGNEDIKSYNLMTFSHVVVV